MTCAKVEDQKEAEASPAEKFRVLIVDKWYLKCLTRTFIMNGKLKQAQQQYLKIDPSSYHPSLYQHFYHAAKLLTFQQDQIWILIIRILSFESEFGVYQMVIASKATLVQLLEVMNQLTALQENPKTKYIITAIKKWGKQKSLESLINYYYFNYYDLS
ncbi:unnamed protein product [Paramecium octaurelia]|uniref:Uncharacterized protein n=1 Tax=Paramecium octaurelia TaxID=43137 RepID=A0A8S1WGL2_PAROT|nr:unnamed protein product [Paramecium octaurelia]